MDLMKSSKSTSELLVSESDLEATRVHVKSNLKPVVVAHFVKPAVGKLWQEIEACLGHQCVLG